MTSPTPEIAPHPHPLVRLLDRFVTRSPRLEADELRRARLAVGGLFIGFFAFTVVTCVQTLRGSLFIAGAAALFLVSGAAVLVLHRRTGSLRLLTHAIPGLLFVHEGLIMVFTGGQFVGTLYSSSVLIPLASVMLIGWRAGVAWTLASALTGVVLLGADQWRQAPIVLLDPVSLEHSNLRGSILMAFVTLGIALTYEWLRGAAMQGAQRARKELERYRNHLEERVEERTRELDASRQQLVDGQRLAGIGTLAAGIAHQINNPVGGILAAAQFANSLAGSEEKSDDIRDALADIEAEARRCGRIVHGLLQFARNEPMEKWVDDVNTVLQQAQRATWSYARERDGELTLAPSPQPALVEMNPIALEQVLVNLIRNGLEARAKDAIVQISAEAKQDAVIIRVRDNGDGISEEQKPHVFDPFFTTRTSEGGTGLGLSVSHGIIREHAGQLRVESELGKGTTFEIELPLCTREDAERSGPKR